jgi:CcmD family protein
MEKRLFKSFAVVFAFLLSFAGQAQNASPEMADLMRNNGKIYVVVAVLVIIFVGMIVYLISLDKKANRLQSELNDLKK